MAPTLPRLLVTTARKVCSNTLTAAPGHARIGLAIKHTRCYRSDTAAAAAQQALQLIFTRSDTFAGEAVRKFNEMMSPGAFRDTVEVLFPAPAGSAPASAIQHDV